jgi:hypothetical protein
MAHAVDGKTQARAVQLAMERSALRVALEARDASHRRRREAPALGLRSRVHFLELALTRLADDIASLERARARLGAGWTRAVHLAGGLGDVAAVCACLVAWALGAWLVAAVAAWPPALAVACAGAPLLAIVPRLWRVSP